MLSFPWTISEVGDTPASIGEYGYLIHLLRCGIYGDIPEEIPKGMSFRNVYDYAMKHDVANLAFYAVEKLRYPPESELYKTWSMRRDLALMRDMHQDFARSELVEAFTKRGIPFKELQGTALKKLYPAPEYRTMSDLDFIVEKSKLGQCGEILTELGYHCKTQGDFEVDGVRSPNIFVEIHTDYFTETSEYFSVMNAPAFHCELTEKEKITELYLYNILHTAKHYYAGGCGIRRVLDMYYLDIFYARCIDEKYVNRVLGEADLTVFASNLSALAQSWFGEQAPGNISDAMVNYILSSGLHGTRENIINSKLRKESTDGKVTFWTKVKYIFGRLFPKKSVMIQKFPVLKKWGILYPFLWIYRIISMISGKNRRAALKDLRLTIKSDKDVNL